MMPEKSARRFLTDASKSSGWEFTLILGARNFPCYNVTLCFLSQGGSLLFFLFFSFSFLFLRNVNIERLRIL